MFFSSLKSLHSRLMVCLLDLRFWQRNSWVHCCLCYTTRSGVSTNLTCSQEGRKKGRKEQMKEESRGESKRRWQQWQLVIVLMKTRPPLSLLHILSLPLSLFFYPPFSHFVSLPLSEAENNEVTPLSRTVPYKNPLCPSSLSLIPSRSHTFSVHILSSTRQACSSPRPY